MQSIEYNLSLLDLMLDDFEAYILSSVLYWPLSTKKRKISPLPRLTLGGFFLTLDELASQEAAMNREQRSQYHSFLRKHERYSMKWQVATSNKAQQELNSRLNLWQAYLKDVEEDPEFIEDYPREVRSRVMISHLIKLSESDHDIEDKKQVMRFLDQRFEGLLKHDDFLWDPQLKIVYPLETFPFLYRSPR